MCTIESVDGTPVSDFASDEQQIAARINQLPRPLEVLEAGCGRRWTLPLNPPYRLTGVDQDIDALRARQQLEGDLDEVIVGDIRSVELPTSGYDVIYCAFVLEHLDRAESALLNFNRWLRPGGVLVIKVPDRGSMYGIAARLTPFWFHVWFYRRIRGVTTAGTPGHGPYPTHYDAVISPEGFTAFCAKRNLVVEATRRVDNYIQGSRVLTALGWLVGVASLGRIAWRWNDLTFVVSKPIQT
jgi:SAM-dependent methyltransferase